MITTRFVCLVAAAGGLHAQSSGPDLNAIAKRIVAQERVVGASVLVAQRGKILLKAGYGFADLGLEAPTTGDSVYHIVGPMMPVTGVAIMQLVERGKLSLDDELSKFIPEFPLQGHRVTVRQLMNHTSGIVDYHYLGDAIESTSRLPKALDEVMGLYSGKRWVNEPGTKWDWSISGFQLLVTILERVTGESYPDYVQKNILTPAAAASTTYCDDLTLTRGLSHAYRRFGKAHVPALENGSAYNTDLRYCSTVSDLYQIWTAVKEKNVIKPETLKKMTTFEGPAERSNPADPQIHYGLALSLNHEDDHRSVGQHGSLLGYSGSLYDFPADQLTVVVLTNTEGQNAYAIGRALARAVLRLPELAAPRNAGTEVTLSDRPVSSSELTNLAGTFLLKAGKLPPNLHDSYAQYVRTYRVFNENGRLMIQVLGQGPERLLKQEDGSFAMRSAARSRISFVMERDRATGMEIQPQGGGLPLAGARVGDGDPETFHRQVR